MDLNLENYLNDELISILQISEKDINISNVQKSLSNKVEQIKKINAGELPENKEKIIEFYTNVAFKVLNNTKKKLAVTEFGRTIGNNYNSAQENINNEFISVKENLLPTLSYAPTVQQNSNFITRHNDMNSVNTFNSNLKQGEINPLIRKSLKKILNINTKFRNNYTITSSTHFSIELPSTIKKVVSMKLVESQFPEMVYTVSDKLGSNSFTLDDGNLGSPFTIVIPNGSYSSSSIVTAINTAIAIIPINVQLSYNPDNGLMTFTQLGGLDISLNFNYSNTDCLQLPSNIYKDQLTLGWLLGFRGNYIKPITSTISKHDCSILVKNQISINNIYFGQSSYTGESLFDPHGCKYFLLSVNDYKNNHNTNFISPFKYQTFADNNIIAKISKDSSLECCEHNQERIYFGPTDIAKLEIKVYDEFCRLIDINNADYSFTLELEVIYDL